MTMEIYPHDLTPSSPIYFYQEDNEALERLLPWTADYIESVYLGSIINPNGDLIPIDWLPIDDLREALTGGGSGTFLLEVGFTSGLAIEWRDNTTLYIFPGQVAHRGSFKRQGLDENTDEVRIIDVTASFRDPAADGDPITGNLFPDTWYYVYAKLDVATTYPEYRVSRIAPTNDEGYGREHPAETGLRFLSCFRSGGGGPPAIRPYHVDGNGRYFWREILLGPTDPAFDVANSPTADWFSIDISAYCPPIADKVILTWVDSGYSGYIRTTDDITDPAGYHMLGGGQPLDKLCMELPVNVMDDETDAVISGTTIDVKDPSGDATTDIAVVGFHVSRE